MPLEKSEAEKTHFSVLRRRFKQNTGAADAEKYVFYGQYYPQLDEFLFKRYFPDVNIRGVFVECGANDGYAGSNCKFFEDTLQWSGYNLEPTPKTYALLEKNRLKSRNLNLALSNICGEIDFVITEPVIGNPVYYGALNRVSGLKFSEAEREDYRVRETVKVTALTWRRFVEDNKIPFVDLFVLDTEGHEAAVIEGMAGSAVLPALLCVENGWSEDIRVKLTELGYVFDIEHFGNHCWIRKDMLGLFALRGLHKNF